MTDTVDAETRRRIMRAVGFEGTGPEARMGAALLRVGDRTARRNWADALGRPDFAWPRERVALFVHGCFWHGCPRHYREPKSNVAFWRAKVGRNAARDRKVARRLRRDGWRVFTAWECQDFVKKAAAVVTAVVERRKGRGA